MPKVMLINVTHAEESRVGIVNEGTLEAFEIESLSREHLKGNIYKGVVHRIHPALEAAFVDIGGGRDAFLPLDEICFRNLPRHKEQAEKEGAEKDDGENGQGRRRRRIRDVIKTGDELLVQIAKEPFGNKPPTLTTFYSLPGRYLVLIPGSDDAGISRRIEGEERSRLRSLIAELNPPEGFGVIVRTAAGQDNSNEELARDMNYLLRLWSNVQDTAALKRAPALVYREHDIVLRTIRDFFTPDIDEIYIDNEEVYMRARDFLRDVMPGKEHVLHLYMGEQPIFSAFDVEAQFESIFKRRVSLRSGGGIVIDTTEALTAIDVNSGGSVRGPNPEETAFRTNMEAAAEVARQMRLRDIGGLIVVDFIDMRDPNHNMEVERVLRDGMRPDKARHEIGRISRFGLLEISRQRLRPTAMATTYATCPTCEGHGAVRTTESAALVALRKVHNRISAGDVAALRVSAPADVALYLLNQKREDLAQYELRYRTKIQVRLSDKLMPHQVDLDATIRIEEPKPVANVSPGTCATPASEPVVEAEGQVAAEGGVPGAKKKRRRGRRRGKGGLRAAEALSEMLTGLAGTVAVGSPADLDVGAEDDESAEDEEGAIEPGIAVATPPADTPAEPGTAVASPPEESAAGAVADGNGDGRARRRRRRGGRGRNRNRPGQLQQGPPQPGGPAREPYRAPDQNSRDRVPEAQRPQRPTAAEVHAERRSDSRDRVPEAQRPPRPTAAEVHAERRSDPRDRMPDAQRPPRTIPAETPVERTAQPTPAPVRPVIAPVAPPALAAPEASKPAAPVAEKPSTGGRAKTETRKRAAVKPAGTVETPAKVPAEKAKRTRTTAAAKPANAAKAKPKAKTETTKKPAAAKKAAPAKKKTPAKSA